MAAISYRPLTAADLETCADIHYEADDELNARHGMPANPRNRTPLVRLFEHMSKGNPERAWGAEQDGRLVGFGISGDRGDMTFLGFLFVLPQLQGKGIGRELLERSMAGSSHRGVCINSIQPVSTALYVRYGMVPRVPLYIVLGQITRELPPLPTGLDVRPVSADAVDRLDLEVTRISRPQDHAFWESFGRTRYGLFRDDDLLGYGFVQSSGRLGPFVVREQAHLLPFVGRLMGQVPPVDAWMVNVPGPAAPVLVGLLEAGMRLEGPPAIYCANQLEIDHSHYLPASFALP